MADINAQQGGVFNVITTAAEEINTLQGAVLSIYNVPADEIKSTAALLTVPYRKIAETVRVSQARLVSVIKGTPANPALRAWWYTLDGHDYYVLRLGTHGKTLVFDLSTGQWSHWSSGDSLTWRPNVGVNWRASGTIAQFYGSNVIVGDDSSGTLWVLNPLLGVDEKIALEGGYVKFPRVATGQLAITARKAEAVYSVNLSASFGSPYTSDNFVSLEYSNDQGNTYITADQPQVSTQGDYIQEFSWRSLGQVRSPGRLFRITDDGAFARIDGMTVNE